eukprot:g3572.t1
MPSDETPVVPSTESPIESATSTTLTECATLIATNNAVTVVKAIDRLQSILQGKGTGDASSTNASSDGAFKTSKMLKLREKALYQLVECYCLSIDTNADKLLTILDQCQPLFRDVPKARTAKHIRNLIDIAIGCVTRIDDETNEGKAKRQTLLANLVTLCHSSVEWATSEKRSFLKQRIQVRLTKLLWSQNAFTEALTLTKRMITETKKLDDKQLLVDLHLTEARIYHSLMNVPKSKSALTAARTNANAVYVSPETQAEIDMQAGLINAEESDFTTAYSYFFEAYEAANLTKGLDAVQALQYMLLCRIMQDKAELVEGLVHSKDNEKYANRKKIKAMVEIAKAFERRSLDEFKAATLKYATELDINPEITFGGDDSGTTAMNIDNSTTSSSGESNSTRNGGAHSDFVGRLIQKCYTTMFEQNLLRIIEPYSCVELNHISELVNRPVTEVQSKLAQMILDEKISGTLDQGVGHLVLREKTTEDRAFKAALSTIDNLSKVVESLTKRAVSFRNDSAKEALASMKKTLNKQKDPSGSENAGTVPTKGKNK